MLVVREATPTFLFELLLKGGRKQKKTYYDDLDPI